MPTRGGAAREGGGRLRHASAAAFNPLKLQRVLDLPRRMSDVSAWIQHVPFAFALIEMQRPRSVVELGVHHGDSYCAFCQAVATLRLACRCTGVDTWEGDEQCGRYGPEVLEDLQAHHDPLYGQFSTLLRGSFDGAAAAFADGSIDLLHLDGRHDDASVRADFDRWSPKLSDAAVVLFHDTECRGPGFEGYRVWEEVAAGRPHFAFTHGCGLGIAAMGPNVAAPVRAFLAAATENPEHVRSFFAALGQRLELARTTARLARAAAGQRTLLDAWRRERGLAARGDGIAPGAEALLDGPFLEHIAVPMQTAAAAAADDLAAMAADNRNLHRAVRHYERVLARLKWGAGFRAAMFPARCLRDGLRVLRGRPG